MAISNYSELVSEVQSYLKRSDLASKIDNWIALFEAHINDEFNTQLNEWTDIEGLSETNATNTLLTSSPHLYLNGVLLEACRFIRNDKEIVKLEPKLAQLKGDYMAAYSTKRAISSGFTIKRNTTP